MQHGVGIVVVLAVFGCATARAQESFELVSITPDGHFGNDISVGPRVSGDGRFVAFESLASDLVVGDTNGSGDVFVRDLDLGITERVSLTSAGAQVTSAGAGGGWIGLSCAPTISHDGSLVAFMAADASVVPGDTNGTGDVFLRDRAAGTTIRISRRPDGGEFVGHCGAAQLSADGGRVLYAHRTGLGTAWVRDWYVFDRASGVTQLVSVVPDHSDVRVWNIHLAAGGRYVVFDAYQTAAPGFTGTFIRDVDAGVTFPATQRSGWRPLQAQTTDADEFTPLAISASGRFVLCHSFEDFDPTDGLDVAWNWNAWVLDRTTERFRLVTRFMDGPDPHWTPNYDSFRGFAYISDEGRTARLRADSWGLICLGYDDTDSFYEFDLARSETRVLSLNWRMIPFEGYSSYDYRYGASDDGRTVGLQGFEYSYLDPLRLWGQSTDQQIYARRVRGSAGVTYCAGDGSGAACPCGTPGLAGRGCANGVGSRGAILEARGNASLTDDSLSFTAYEGTWGPTILLQSTNSAPSGGVPFGGGVLCVASPVTRIAVDEPLADDLGSLKLFGRGAFWGPLLHELGAVSAPGTRYYQVWTRAVGGPSCVQSHSSLTNGVRVEWRL